MWEKKVDARVEQSNVVAMATVGCAQYVPPAEQSAEDLRFMRMAMDMAQEAFDHEEVPVGCVFVQDGRVIAQGRNRTNELLNVRAQDLRRRRAMRSSRRSTTSYRNSRRATLILGACPTVGHPTTIRCCGRRCTSRSSHV